MIFAPSPLSAVEPPHDCPRCPRLVDARMALRQDNPTWWNAPVPAFGDPEAWLAIVGLAPGLHGANRTGRAFTGDTATMPPIASIAAATSAAGPPCRPRRFDPIPIA